MPVKDNRESLKTMEGTFLVFETTHLTMKAESILKDAGIPVRLFPKPRKVISECGLIVKVLDRDLDAAKGLLEGRGVKIKSKIYL
jgi:hypothetical protein